MLFHVCVCVRALYRFSLLSLGVSWAPWSEEGCMTIDLWRPQRLLLAPSRVPSDRRLSLSFSLSLAFSTRSSAEATLSLLQYPFNVAFHYPIYGNGRPKVPSLSTSRHKYPPTLPASSALSLTQSQFNYTIVKSCTIVFSATQPVSRRIRQEFEFTWMTSCSNPSPAVGASTYVFRPSLVFSNATSEHWKLVQSLIKPTDECTVGMGGITSASRTPTIKSSGYHGGGYMRRRWICCTPRERELRPNDHKHSSQWRSFELDLWSATVAFLRWLNSYYSNWLIGFWPMIYVHTLTHSYTRWEPVSRRRRGHIFLRTATQAAWTHDNWWRHGRRMRYKWITNKKERYLMAKGT